MVQTCPRCQRANPREAVLLLLRRHRVASRAAWERRRRPSCRRSSSFRRAGAARPSTSWCRAASTNGRTPASCCTTATSRAISPTSDRHDLARAARENQDQADPDIALHSFLGHLPAGQVQGPRLDLNPRRLMLGGVRPGEQRQISADRQQPGQGAAPGQGDRLRGRAVAEDRRECQPDGMCPQDGADAADQPARRCPRPDGPADLQRQTDGHHQRRHRRGGRAPRRGEPAVRASRRSRGRPVRGRWPSACAAIPSRRCRCWRAARSPAGSRPTAGPIRWPASRPGRRRRAAVLRGHGPVQAAALAAVRARAFTSSARRPKVIQAKVTLRTTRQEMGLRPGRHRTALAARHHAQRQRAAANADRLRGRFDPPGRRRLASGQRADRRQRRAEAGGARAGRVPSAARAVHAPSAAAVLRRGAVGPAAAAAADRACRPVRPRLGPVRRAAWSLAPLGLHHGHREQLSSAVRAGDLVGGHLSRRGPGLAARRPADRRGLRRRRRRLRRRPRLGHARLSAAGLRRRAAAPCSAVSRPDHAFAAAPASGCCCGWCWPRLCWAVLGGGAGFLLSGLGQRGLRWLSAAAGPLAWLFRCAASSAPPRFSSCKDDDRRPLAASILRFSAGTATARQDRTLVQRKLENRPVAGAVLVC